MVFPQVNKSWRQVRWLREIAKRFHRAHPIAECNSAAEPPNPPFSRNSKPGKIKSSPHRKLKHRSIFEFYNFADFFKAKNHKDYL